MSTARAERVTPFDEIGGREALNKLAVRFYEIMSSRPDASGIRAMHKADLSRVADSLAEFLMGWMGGPRDWFQRQDRPCIMGLHRALPIGESERDQWLACMKQAMEETVASEALRAELEPAFFRIADAMRTR
jgi:hemoglobin